MTFGERYIRNVFNFRYLSLLAIGFIFSILFFEAKGNILNFFYLQSEFDSAETTLQLKIAIVFQSVILILFAIRFITLYFKKSKYVWTSQFLWLANWIAILIYHLVSESYGCCYAGEHLPSLFLRMLNITSSWLVAYWILSFIKQIVILAISLFKIEVAINNG